MPWWNDYDTEGELIDTWRTKRRKLDGFVQQYRSNPQLARNLSTWADHAPMLPRAILLNFAKAGVAPESRVGKWAINNALVALDTQQTAKRGQARLDAIDKTQPILDFLGNQAHAQKLGKLDKQAAKQLEQEGNRAFTFTDKQLSQLSRHELDHPGPGGLGGILHDVGSGIGEVTRPTFGALQSGAEAVAGGFRTAVGAAAGTVAGAGQEATGRIGTAASAGGGGPGGFSSTYAVPGRGPQTNPIPDKVKFGNVEVSTDINTLTNPKQITLYNMIKGESSGSGFFPSGQAHQTQEEASRAAGAVVLPNGERSALTPGRFIASTVVEPGTKPYNAVSGVVDLGVALYADPANIALGKAADIAKERKLFTPEAAGAMSGAISKFVHGPTYTQWANSTAARKVFDHIAKTGEIRTLRRQLGHEFPPELLPQLQDAKTAEEVAKIIEPVALGGAVRNIPKWGMDWRQYSKDIRWLSAMPHGHLSPTDPGNNLDQLERLLVTGKVDGKTTEKLLSKVARTHDFEGLADIAFHDVNDALKASAMGEYGVARSDADKMFSFMRNVDADIRTTAIDDIGNPALIHMPVSLDGEAFQILGPHLENELLNKTLPLPDIGRLREIRHQVSILSKTPGVGKLWNSKSLKNATALGDFFMSDVWKPITLLRGAWTVRVIGEEQVRMASAGLDSMFHHPISHMAYVLGKKGAIDADKIKFQDAVEQIGNFDNEFVNTLARRGEGSATGVGRVEQASDDGRIVLHNWTRYEADQPEFLPSWTDEYTHIANSALVRETARSIRETGSTDAAKAKFWGDEGTDVVRYGRGTSVGDEADSLIGEYTTPLDRTTASPHAIAGRNELKGRVQPKNILTMEPGELPIESMHGFAEGAGPLAIRELLGEDELARLAQLDEKQLTEELGRKFPGHDYSALNGRGELIDAYGAQLARSRGYDALAYRASDPAYDEMVLLSGAAAKPGGGLSDVRERMQRANLWDNKSGSLLSTREGSDAFIDSVEQRIRQVTNDNEDLIDGLATGNYTKGGYTSKELRAKLKELHNAGESPQFTRGRMVADGKARTNVADKVVTNLFNAAMTIPTNKLSRSVTFKQFYWRKMEDLLPYMDEQSQVKMMEAWHEAGLGKLEKGPIGLLPRKLKKPITSGEMSLDLADKVAKGHGLDETRKLLYDVSERGNSWDALRLVIPFGEAFKEVTTRWAKLITQNPRLIRRAQQGVEGARGAGFFRTDPETGEEYFVYPFSGQLTKAVTSGFGLSDVPGLNADLRGQVKSLNIIGNGLPSVGPVVQIPVAHLLPKDEKWDWIRNYVNPYGDAESNVMDSLFPSWAQKLKTGGWLEPLGVVPKSAEDDRLFSNAVKDAASSLASTGHYDLNTPEGLDKLNSDATITARRLYAWRSMAQFVSPAAPRPVDKIKGKDGHLYELYSVARDFQRMKERNGGDWSAATMEFIDRYGSTSYLSLEPRGQREVYGVPTTAQAEQWRTEHSTFADQHPDVYGYFAPQGGDFDYNAYTRAVKRGDIKPQDSKVWLRKANDRVASAIANTLRAKLPANPSQRQYNWLAEQKAGLAKDFPGYDPKGEQTRTSMDQQVLQLKSAVKNRSVKNTKMAQATSVYLELRDKALKVAARRKGLSPANATLTGEKAADLREWLREQGAGLQKDAPEFTGVWDGVFSYELREQ